jgi:hypothetical protein
MLTPEQQQVAIVWLIVVVAVVMVLALAGGVVWYLVFTKGLTPLALVLLLPVLWITAVFMPLIWLFGASIQHWQESHEATGHAWPQHLPGEGIGAETPQPQDAPTVAGSGRDTSRELGQPDRTSVPAA